MNIFLRILLGIAVAGVGIFFTIKTRTILDLLGGIDYFDQKLGPNGTSLFYKLLGIVMSLVGFLIATNMWDAFLQATLGSIFPKA